MKCTDNDGIINTIFDKWSDKYWNCLRHHNGYETYYDYYNFEYQHKRMYTVILTLNHCRSILPLTLIQSDLLPLLLPLIVKDSLLNYQEMIPYYIEKHEKWVEICNARKRAEKNG